MCVVEEASAVPEEIFEVLDGALSLPKNKMLMIGNPAATFGRFYDSFHSKKDTFQNLWWNGTESPLVSPELIKIFEDEYGRGSREWSVRIEWAFPKKGSGMLLGASEISSLENVDVELSFDGYAPPEQDLEYENKFKISWKVTNKVRIYNLGQISKLKGKDFYKAKVGVEVSL